MTCSDFFIAQIIIFTLPIASSMIPRIIICAIGYLSILVDGARRVLLEIGIEMFGTDSEMNFDDFYSNLALIYSCVQWL